MVWPTANEYLEAVRHPLRHFCKPELKRSQAALDAQGKPEVRSGRCLDVYEMRGAGGVERWAIGCFKQQPNGVARRYRIINDHLQSRPVAALVETEYQSQGICIRGKWYPITRSRWVDGKPLNAYVRDYLDHPDELRLLATVWVRLAQELQGAGIAHGNLQSETVLVAPGHGGALALRLVDYDSIFLPGVSELVPEQPGHVDYQHPSRTWPDMHDADVDRFPQLVVLTALYALAVEGRALWDRFDAGDNLLFRQEDFQKPSKSALFRALWQSESNTVRALTGQLILASEAKPDEVPALELVTECLRPGAAKTALNRWQIDKINDLMKSEYGDLDFNIAVDDEVTEESNCEDTPLAYEADEEVAVLAVPVLQEAVRQGPPPLALAAPPPLPTAAALVHPLAQTFQLDAWMPEEVAVVKLRGFVKDVGGEVIESVPGFIRVHLFNERDLVRSPVPASNLLAMLGLVPSPPPPLPRVRAVMELNLVHKSTPTRKLIGITMRLAPGPEDEGSAGWKRYCDRVYCELRGYVIGAG